jgi:type I restriction-modification system DNA methylase subunit
LKSAKRKSESNGANLGFEAKLRLTADKLRNNMDAAEHKHVVRVLVEMLAPDKGRIYDACCGSAGVFVQSEKFVEEHGGRIGDIVVYGRECNLTTWRLAMMNLALRGIEGDLGPVCASKREAAIKTNMKGLGYGS